VTLRTGRFGPYLQLGEASGEEKPKRSSIPKGIDAATIELERALQTDVKIIGINNRNLKSFTVDLATTEILAEEVPDDVILISESGIKSVADAERVALAGADGILVGETLMRHEQPLDMGRALQVYKGPIEE
jgi:indole-3-glycerol phosphate synthase